MLAWPLDIQIEDGFAVDTSATSGNALTVTSGPTVKMPRL